MYYPPSPRLNKISTRLCLCLWHCYLISFSYFFPINYIPESSSELSLDFLLALLNSAVFDWFFRLSSTNAAVSHYQIYQLPVPAIEEVSPPNWWFDAAEAEKMIQSAAAASA